MKPVYFALCLLLCTGVRAQHDFQLFRPGVQYLYENPDFIPNPTSITSQYYGVRVDSLGRQPLYGSLQPGVDESQCVYKVPSPFGYAITQYADSTVMHFSETDSLVIYQQAEVGTRWVARDSAGTITYGEVLGQLLNDTTYFISDVYTAIGFFGPDGRTALGPPIIIGKRYGLLSGLRMYQLSGEREPLSLVGLSDPKLGVQLPEPDDYTRVTAGDIFHIERTDLGTDSGPTGATYFFAHTFYTAEILSVDTMTDAYTTFTYTGDVLTFRSDDQEGERGNRDSTLVRDTVIQVRVAALPVELYIQPGARTAEADYPSLHLLYAADTCGTLISRLSPQAIFRDEVNCGFNSAGVDAGPGSTYSAYVPFSIDSVSGQTGPYFSQLRYKEMGGETCGTPFNLADVIIATDDYDATFDRLFSVFPNPARERLNVRLPGTVNYQVRLYNAAGALVQSQSLQGGAGGYIPTAGLPEGTYFLLVFERGLAVGRRSVVVHH